MPVSVLILHATGTNRDHDVAQAFETVGARPEIVHINQLRRREKRWSDYQVLVLPGGFSYADALGAGRLFALDLNVYFNDQVHTFIASGKPVIGICNGFQALVKSGLLPGSDIMSQGKEDRKPAATLSFNESGQFECRWVTLSPRSQVCIWTRGLTDTITCPVAHGEGRFMLSQSTTQSSILNQLIENDQVALVYATFDGTEARGHYPLNPNGSEGDIAGICNQQGNVLGLMPHPENHIFPYQHPRWSRFTWGSESKNGHSGLMLFENGVKYASEL